MTAPKPRVVFCARTGTPIGSDSHYAGRPGSIEGQFACVGDIYVNWQEYHRALLDRQQELTDPSCTLTTQERMKKYRSFSKELHDLNMFFGNHNEPTPPAGSTHPGPLQRRWIGQLSSVASAL